ncbi:cell wall protein DAN4-like, partial [Aplysia californica]|uniref:Cell wall protein DAN4-like n=1 Tax=Aplysia californica TaxID=6500 RepID=A0ABM0KBI8_APLCA
MSIRASDDCGNTVDGTLTIEVTNQDPTFSNLDHTLSQPKGDFSVSTTVYTVLATDVDSGTDGDSVTYSLTSVTPTADFSINSGTGAVSPSTSALTLGTYTLSVMASDCCGGTANGTLTIEDGDDITCSVSSSPSGPFSTKFVYDNGNLTSAVILQASPSLSASTTSSYELTVTCQDTSSASDSNTLYVYVTQNSVPVISNLQNMTTISSNLSSGSEVFRVLATDPEGDQTFFSLTCVTPASPCPFQIYSTGAILLSSSLTGTSTAG